MQSNVKTLRIPIYVGDLDASKKFYVQTLGFECVIDLKMADDTRKIYLRFPSINAAFVSLHSLDEMSTKWEPALDAPYLFEMTVDNLLELSRFINSRSIQSSKVIEVPYGLFFLVTDPDGNKIQLSELFVDEY
jgi:catechol 2,3-dioxygenase-like lactoylglutathione lyase family enzyme